MNSNQIAVKTREGESKHANVCQQTCGRRTILPDKSLGKLHRVNSMTSYSLQFPRDLGDALVLKAGTEWSA